MNKRLFSMLVSLAVLVCAAAALADAATVITRPLRPWFTWMLP